MFKQSYGTVCAFFCGMAIERGDYFVAAVCVLAGVVGWYVIGEEE